MCENHGENRSTKGTSVIEKQGANRSKGTRLFEKKTEQTARKGLEYLRNRAHTVRRIRLCENRGEDRSTKGITVF